MTDHLPPERPLSDDARARIRADLREEVHTAPGRRAWLVPLAAAASVAAVVGVVAWVNAGGDPASTLPVGASSSEVTGVDPTSSTQPSPRQTAPSRSASLGATCSPDTIYENEAGEYTLCEGDGSGPVVGPVGQSCASSIGEQLAEPGTWSEVARIDHAGGGTSLWRSGQKSYLCDQWGDITTIMPSGAGGGVSADDFAVSMNFTGKESLYVAGGAAIPGATAITYAFAQGDTVEATVTDQMWSMVSLPTDGPWAAADSSPLVGTTTTVTVTYADGHTDQFELSFPEVFCAQLNHGC